MDSEARMAGGSPAPYGCACLNCVRAKCKCIIFSLGGSCERCRRLGKECRPSALVRKKTPKRSPASRDTHLEEKLDSIVALLKASAQSSPVTVNDNAVLQPEFGHNGLAQTNRELPIPSPFTGSANSDYDGILTPGASEPSSFEAEGYLRTFRTQTSEYFPFVYIPPTISAQQLLQERPVLWHCIMAIFSRSTTQQLAIGNKIRHVLAQKMVLESENNLDLLLGLLAYVGWAKCQMQKILSLSLFTQMAVSLIFSLGLNKPITEDLNTMSNDPSHTNSKASKSTVRTTEERRAVLSCFLVTSIISSFLQRIDTLRWTSHMDECLQTLAEGEECPMDAILVQQVKLQLIVEEARQISLSNGEFRRTEPVRAPSTFYLKALQSQVQQVKHNLPARLQANEVVMLHLYSTELTVNEVEPFEALVESNSPNFHRLESLYASLNAIKSWFDVFFTISPAAYISFPFSIFSQLVHCLVGLQKLSTLDDQAWDKDLVRSTADLLLILNQVVFNMRQVDRLVGLDNDSTESGVFVKTANRFDAMRASWERTLAGPLAGLADMSTIDLDEAMREMAMDFSDTSWFSNIFMSI